MSVGSVPLSRVVPSFVDRRIVVLSKPAKVDPDSSFRRNDCDDPARFLCPYGRANPGYSLEGRQDNRTAVESRAPLPATTLSRLCGIVAHATTISSRLYWPSLMKVISQGERRKWRLLQLRMDSVLSQARSQCMTDDTEKNPQLSDEGNPTDPPEKDRPQHDRRRPGDISKDPSRKAPDRTLSATIASARRYRKASRFLAIDLRRATMTTLRHLKSGLFISLPKCTVASGS